MACSRNTNHFQITLHPVHLQATVYGTLQLRNRVREPAHRSHLDKRGPGTPGFPWADRLGCCISEQARGTPHYGPISSGKSSGLVSHDSASLGPSPFLCLRQPFLPPFVTECVIVDRAVVAGVCREQEVIPGSES